MSYFDPTKNKIHFGSTDKLIDWLTEYPDQGKIISKIKLLLKNYLELDNVSFLFGSGTSIHLGAVSIRNFPSEVYEYIKEKDGTTAPGILGYLQTTIKTLQFELYEYGNSNLKPGTKEFKKQGWTYFIDSDELVCDNDSKEIAIEYERVLNYLIALDFVLSEDKSSPKSEEVSNLIVAIKEGLFKVCNIECLDYIFNL